ncbi:MAG: carboxypeptidase regulatory-like domain-containing protein [Candidatus Eremiobacteraeota bacterium]|nr:carboxypeptidase regulatory-like domain-containing protein [Candidatus Eremiobacteraeota bacterium]
MLTVRHFRRSAFTLALFFTPLFIVVCAERTQAAGGVTGTLRGTVVDERTNAPIAGVAVSVASPSGRYRTTSDAHGFFVFPQIPTDTYLLSLEKNGYTAREVAGVTVLGDQTQSVGTLRLTPALRTIGSVRSVARSSSAFQPNQTVDETTFVGARVDQALGEKGSTNFDQLVLAAPGVIQTAAGSANAFSIRGSASVEIGYQFDGVDYRGSWFDENPSQGFLNGIGGGRGALQVVSGAGDATQGGIGAGVVNVIPGRGSYPGSGFASFDVSAPWYDHAFAFQYGIATPNGRFSDFFSARSDRFAPQIAPYGRDASDAGQYLGTSLTYDDDVLNNFYYRFGKNNDQQIQVLVDWLDHRAWAQYGGLANVNYYPYDPLSYGNFQTDSNGADLWGCLQPSKCVGHSPFDQVVANQQLAWYQAVIPYLPGVPRTYQPVTQPEQYIFGPTNFLKLGYTRALNQTTSFNTFFYNWGGLVANNITGNSSDLTTGSAVPGYNEAGGRRVGFQAQLTKIAGEKHTLTFIGKFENGFPYWTQQNVGNTFQSFIVDRGQDETNFGSFGPGQYPINGPRVEDWYLPVHLGQPISASNPCIGPSYDNGFDPTMPTHLGCYLYSWLLSHGKWTGSLPSMPTMGWDLHQSDFQQFGVGARDQWSPSARLHVDYGLRVDGQNLRWGRNPFSADLGNPSDVGYGIATIGNGFLYPRFVQPRLSVDYVATPRDSVRAAYGRSISFFFGQTAGTPAAAAFINPVLYQVPAKDSPFINTNPSDGPITLGPACGSGWHGPGSNGNGTYLQNPWVYYSGAGVSGNAGWYFKCPNYASSLFWAFDQAYSAPDLGGGFPATYNNYDVAWEHQFRSGWGSKLTAYWRRGFGTYQATFLNSGPPNPVTGQQTAGAFQYRETGIQKAFGLEFMLTTPDRPAGLSGFLTANYVNELTNTPPVAGSDSLPIVPQFLYQTGTLFHQSYLPPLSARAGIEYKFKDGLRINPILSFDNGFPFGVGRDAIGFVNGVLYHLPTSNIGVATPYAGPGLPNQSYNATCYVDPSFVGSAFHPHYYACRGYSEPALAGQSFTRPRLYSDLDLEYTRGRVTMGVYVSNLFDNYRAEPTINTDWQPIATGRGGLQSGQFTGSYPTTQSGTPNPFYLEGARNLSVYDQYWLPYQELYVPGRQYRFYLQFNL